jgi:Beta-lactamase enzyme family
VTPPGRRVSSALAVVLLAVAASGPSTPAADPPANWEPDVAAAREYAQARQGTITFHVRTERGRWSYDADRAVPSASVIKAMLMAAYLDRPDVRDRPLTAADHRLLDPMIRRSGNRAATRVRDMVGNEALLRLARRAGMTRFASDPVWGLSRITARDQTRLWLRLESLLPPRHREYALELLRTIVPRQRWGFGRLAYPPGWELFFKGGWGSGTGLVEHQVALLRRGPERVAIAILTTGSPSHAYGKRTLRGVAARLLHGLR